MKVIQDLKSLLKKDRSIIAQDGILKLTAASQAGLDAPKGARAAVAVLSSIAKDAREIGLDLWSPDSKVEITASLASTVVLNANAQRQAVRGRREERAEAR